MPLEFAYPTGLIARRNAAENSEKADSAPGPTEGEPKIHLGFWRTILRVADTSSVSSVGRGSGAICVK